jgi:mRNA interferase RelE/StbE
MPNFNFAEALLEFTRMYAIELKPQAQKFMEKQPKKIQRQLVAKIESLQKDPRPAQSRLLHSDRQIYRLRSGDYRIIYQIKDDRLLVLVVKVDNRKDVYKNLLRYL